MSTGQTIQLILQALVFLAWAVLMFRVVSTIRSRAEEQDSSVSKQMGRWMRSPADKSERNTLFFLTFVLVAMLLSSAFLGGPQAGP